MRKIIFALLLVAPVAAQTINPNQIRPSTIPSQCLITSGGVTTWGSCSGGGGISLTTTGTGGAATYSAGNLNIPVYQQAITLTTTGTSGPSTLSGGTLNIPQYTGGSGGTPGGTSGQTQYNNGGSFGGYTPSGDVTVNPSTGVETIQPGVVTNTKLANASTTVNGTTCTLGAPCTIASGSNVNALWGFGTSIIAAAGSTNPAQLGLFSLLCGTTSAPCYNYGASSSAVSQDVDTLLAAYAPSYQNPSAMLFESGENNSTCGTTCNISMQNQYYAADAWVAIPPTYRQLASVSGATTGTWTYDSTLPIYQPTAMASPGLPQSSTASGSTKTFTIPSSASPVVGITFGVKNGYTGTFTVRIDGSLVTDNCSGTTTFSSTPCETTITGFNYGFYREEYTVTTGISHTVVVTTTNSGESVIVGVDWIPPSSEPTRGIVFHQSVLANYPSYSTFNPIAIATVNKLHADGLLVFYVDQVGGTPGINTTTDISVTATPACAATVVTGHPNDCGNLHGFQTIVNTENAVGINIGTINQVGSSVVNNGQFTSQITIGNLPSGSQYYSAFGLAHVETGILFYHQGNVFGIGMGQDASTGLPYSGAFINRSFNTSLWNCDASYNATGLDTSSNFTSSRCTNNATGDTYQLGNMSATKVFLRTLGASSSGLCTTTGGEITNSGCTGGGGGGNTTSTSLTTNRLPKANGANSIIDSSLSDNGTVVTSTEPLVGVLPGGSVSQGAFAVGTLGYSDTGMLGSFQGNTNGFLQMDVQNTNAGASASSDFIVANDQGTATTHYGDFGINSSGFTGSPLLNTAGATYLYSATGDLEIGTATSNIINLSTNSATTAALTVNTSNQVLVPQLTSGSLTKASTGGLLANAVAGTDYQVPITLTTTGTSGAATFSGGTLNIPQYSGGGSTGISGATSGQALIAGSATTATSSVPLAGSGAGLTTGPVSGTVSGAIPKFNSTSGQLGSSLFQDSGTAGVYNGANGFNSGIINTPAFNVCVDTSGSGTAQVCNTTINFTPLSGSCIVYSTSTANTGTGLTLNVNSLGAKSVSKWMGSTTTLAANDVLASKSTFVCYDGTTWELSDIGNAPTGGSSGLSGMTAGQVPIAATASTVTSSMPLAGAGAGIVTGPTTTTTNDVAYFTGTAGQLADTGITRTTLVVTNATNTFTKIQEYTVGQVAAASTVAPTTSIVEFTGASTTINTITAPTGTAALIGASFDFFVDNSQTISATGNVVAGFTAAVNTPYRCVFMGTTNGKWFCK